MSEVNNPTMAKIKDERSVTNITPIYHIFLSQIPQIKQISFRSILYSRPLSENIIYNTQIKLRINKNNIQQIKLPREDNCLN